MKHTQSLFVAATFTLMAACAHVAPKELADAREAYRRASTGVASELTPADVHKAKVALDQAERAFADDPTAQSTKDLAYVADRMAQIAEVLALQSQSNRDKKKAQEAYTEKQAAIQQATKAELASTKRDLASSDQKRQQDAQATDRQREQTAQENDRQRTQVAQENDRQRAADADKLAAERIGRQDAEDKTAAAEKKVVASEAKNTALEVALAKLAAFKQEPRGLVLTLSGGVMFVSNEATLLPTAQGKLNEIAAALMTSDQRGVVVEGHTDSQGSDSRNNDLSRRRAEAVRTYLVGRGYPAEKISANGLGKTRPIANNKTAEGRANNRRVEIVVAPL